MNKVWADKNVNDLAITWTYKVFCFFLLDLQYGHFRSHNLKYHLEIHLLYILFSYRSHML